MSESKFSKISKSRNQTILALSRLQVPEKVTK
jgi:hypothetical protein